MRPKVFVSILVGLALLLSFGVIVKDAQADAIMFPWVVRSASVTTLISVVNTAQSVPESCGLPLGPTGRLHWEYFYKETIANDQEEMCEEHNFESTSSKDDMVTFDVAGVFNTGLSLFNDVGSDPIFVQDFTLPVASPRRAFLLVDNNTSPHIAFDGGGNIIFQTNVDGTVYGEALVLERQSGASWGYIAYNARGGVKSDPADLNLSFADDDYRDMHGEVIGDDDTMRCEMAPVTVLPPDLVTTRFFITPTASANNNGFCPAGDNNQRQGNINSIIQLCASPGPDPEDPDCDCPPGGGGMWNNVEGKISFLVRKDIVCTSADNLVELMGLTAYNSFAASGMAGWTYVDADRGNLNTGLPNDIYCESDELIVGKLEFATGDTMFDGATITISGGADLDINNFVWLRNNRNYLAYCQANPGNWRCDPDGGLNLIHNEIDDCPL